jgi:hypothetical protein
LPSPVTAAAAFRNCSSCVRHKPRQHVEHHWNMHRGAEMSLQQASGRRGASAAPAVCSPALASTSLHNTDDRQAHRSNSTLRKLAKLRKTEESQRKGTVQSDFAIGVRQGVVVRHQAIHNALRAPHTHHG